MIKKKDIVTNIILTIITCGIYGYYWCYLVAKALMQAQSKYELPTDDYTLLYIILRIFGLSIVNYCLIQNELNLISTKISNNEVI